MKWSGSFTSQKCDFKHFTRVKRGKAARSLKDVAALAERRHSQLNFQFKQGLYKGSDAVQNLHIDVIKQAGV